MAEDQGAAAFRTGQNASLEPGGDKDGFAGMAERSVTAINRLLQSVIPFMPKLSNAGEVGLFAGLEPNKAVDLNKPIVAAGSGLSMKGGVLANGLFKELLKKPDFSGIVAAAVEGIPVQAPEIRSGADFFTPAIDHGLGNIGAGGRGMDMDLRSLS